MAEHGIELKGSSFTLSVVHIADQDINEVKRLLAEKIAVAPAFFRAAPLVINIEKLTQAPDFTALAEALRDLDLVPVGVTGAKDEATRAAVRAAGLAVISSGKATATAAPTYSEPKEVPAELLNLPNTKVHRGPVRSGQQVYAPNGSLVVLGSVSNGAEVIADDSVHIYGQLRGRAVAGAKGNESARIYCQQLTAELISVAGHYQISAGLQSEHWEQPVTISLVDEQLTFDRL